MNLLPFPLLGFMLCLTKTSSNKYKHGNILLKLTGLMRHAHARSTTERQVDNPGHWRMHTSSHVHNSMDTHTWKQNQD